MIAGASAVAAASKSVRRVIVYGGCGALGSALVKYFAKHNWNVISVDFKDNPAAAQSVVVDVRASLAEQGLNVINALQKLSIGEEKPNIDAVICVAGGWTGGSIVSEDVFEATERMYQQSVYSSVIAGHIASKCLKRDGLLLLTGAWVVKEGGTPGMVGYGMAKAAVHHLVRSLADPASKLPPGTRVAAILPITIDTPANRSGMPDADFSAWTPPDHLCGKIYSWASEGLPFPNGGLVKFVTKDGNTEFVADLGDN